VPPERLCMEGSHPVRAFVCWEHQRVWTEVAYQPEMCL
jgi:hypothetical protein